jgi:hypothetical protein
MPYYGCKRTIIKTQDKKYLLLKIKGIYIEYIVLSEINLQNIREGELIRLTY